METNKVTQANGESLQDRLDAQGSLVLAEILHIGQQVASRLAAAHDAGLVHCDVQPGAILLDGANSDVKITNFSMTRGNAAAAANHLDSQTESPDYLSPEQVEGKPVDHRSDLFSFGCVMYAMCVGGSPFRGERPADVKRSVCLDTPAAVDRLNPTIPRPLAALINNLLEKLPYDRISSATEVAQRLSDLTQRYQQPIASVANSAPVSLDETPVDIPVECPVTISPVEPRILELHPHSVVAKKPRAMRCRQKRLLPELIKVVIGGILGCILAVLILWYGFGKDPLGIMRPREQRPTHPALQPNVSPPPIEAAETPKNRP